MSIKLLTAAALALSLAAGTAVAQTATGSSNDAATTGTGQASTNPSAEGPEWTSDQERMMYEENATMMSGFFTDETMTTLKPEAELKANFEAMGADDQAAMKSACERAKSSRDAYGSVTASLCQQAGVAM